MARVWPDVTVEESNFRFHMVSLRKALGDEKGRSRYIKTILGSGYCFVSPISQILGAYDSTPNSAGDFANSSS
jgi:DNA-binding winged helix-turn-helix (wHTH) protein